ncbi:MAG: hypothetical protein ABIW79_09480 [Gemmatimonas sp.]
MLLVVGATGLSGCEKIKASIRPAPTGDAQWQADSSLLASNPDFLFRVRRLNGDVRVVPLTTIGAQGFRPLYFGNRGWRAFDLEYLQKGLKLNTYNDGRVVGKVELTMGMWETSPLDTIPGCAVIAPAARAAVANGVTFLTNGKRGTPRPVRPLGAGELQAALQTVTTLIAPTTGVSGSMLAKYQREVHVVASGASDWPTIVVVYDDAESLPDSIAPMGQRPRHLIVILDRGRYGYRPSYTYSTVSNRRSPPRYVFLDYLDVDDDGRAELFFGLREPPNPVFALYTYVLHFENDAWREKLRYEARQCQAFEGGF